MLKIAVFLVSLLSFAIILYIIGEIWFRGKRGPYLRVFFFMGIALSFWALLNGVNVIVGEETYVRLYPLSMFFVCLAPSLLLWYMLFFTGSKYTGSRPVTWTLLIALGLDLALLATNPWHKGLISSYEGLRPLPGRLFALHALLSYAPLAASLYVLMRYVVRNIRRTPSLGIMAFGIALPLVLNILYTFNVVDLGFDITPLSFLLMFAVFAGYSIHFRLFDVRETAFTNLFASLSDASLIVDNQNLIVHANAAFQKAFPSLSLTVEQTTANDVADHLKHIVQNQEPPDALEALPCPERELHAAEITVSAHGGKEARNYALSKDLVFKRGQYAGYIITFSDISSYRQMINEIHEKNEALTKLKNLAESASNAKSAFLANMSHEIRTPMNAIIGMTSIAKATNDPQRVAECLDKIHAASKHLLGVLNDILDMSKIESCSYELHEDQLVLSRMIEDIVGIVSARIEEKEQQFTLTVDKDIPRTVVADELRLSQVICNLLSNATKFTPEGGRVELAVRMLGWDGNAATLQFIVKDNGIGISPESQATLFNAFEQADLSISRKFGGTGLGLAISQRIVQLMGGRIGLESAPGQGSCFDFVITVQCPPPDPQDGAAEPGAFDTEGSSIYDFTGHTLLLVEDVEINREIILALMEETGVTIDCAENGQIGAEMFAANPHKYDLIYMDIHMPVLDGYSATDKIRALNIPYAQAVPIVAMTANAFAEDVERAKKHGMNDHIAKPIDVETLFHKTNQFFKKSSLWKQAFDPGL